MRKKVGWEFKKSCCEKEGQIPAQIVVEVLAGAGRKRMIQRR